VKVRRDRHWWGLNAGLTTLLAGTLLAIGAGSASATAGPSLALDGFPRSVIVDSFYAQFHLTEHNPGTSMTNVRVDVAITGTTNMAASDLRLQYASGIWPSAVLSGTADGAGGITGYFAFNGATTGMTLATGDTTRLMRLGFVTGTPSDTLHVKFNLDVIDPSTDAPTATLASQAATVDIVPRSTPTAPNRHLSVASGSTTSFVLASGNADGLPPRFSRTSPGVGAVTDRGPGETSGDGARAVQVTERFTYSAPKDFVGTTTFTYTARDPGSEVGFDTAPSSTGTVTITVTRATTHLIARITPSRVSLGTRQQLSITAHTTGTPAPHVIVHIGGAPNASLLVLHNGVGTLALTIPGVGSHRITITYPGTTTTAPTSALLTDSITKATTRLTARVSPHAVTTSTRHPVVAIRVTASAGSTSGGQVRIYRGRHRLATARVTHGVARFVLPRQPAGRKTWTIRYRGTATTAATAKTIRVVVHQA
jgi:hypothetical protein